MSVSKGWFDEAISLSEKELPWRKVTFKQVREIFHVELFVVKLSRRTEFYLGKKSPNPTYHKVSNIPYGSEIQIAQDNDLVHIRLLSRQNTVIAYYKVLKGDID